MNDEVIDWSKGYECNVCGGWCDPPPNEYHPNLYCELIALGHADPAAYLASFGFARTAEA